MIGASSSTKLKINHDDDADDVDNDEAALLNYFALVRGYDVNAGDNANGLSVRVPHSRRQPIGIGGRKHLVGAKDVQGMGLDADVVRVAFVRS